MLVILTPSQIQYGGFIRASMKKIRDMIRDRARILCLIFLWVYSTAFCWLLTISINFEVTITFLAI